MDDAQQAALATLASQMFAEPIATGEVVVVDPPQAAPAAAPQPPAAQAAPQVTPEAAPVAAPVAAPAPEDLPTFKPKLDDDLQALLDEPDFDAEARAEVAAELDDPETAYEYTDPETAAANRAKDKRIAFLEGQLVAKSKKGWIEEAKRAFPDLARLIPGEIEAINATSRRAFIREAAAKNERYSTVLGPTIARLEADRAAIAAGAVSVAREEVANAWGRPAADTLPSDAAAQADALKRARETGGLEGAIKALMNDPSIAPVL